MTTRAVSAIDHSPGLWANTDRTHPFLNEDPANAAHRRVQQDMGLQAELRQAFVPWFLKIMKHLA